MSGAVTSPVLSAIQIQKLGHKLVEIRVRALNNVLSKLDYGFISEKELICQQNLIVKLLDWFHFETCPEKEKVLKLILRLVKADVDGILHGQIKTGGIRTALNSIRSRVEPSLLHLIDEIVSLIKNLNLENHDASSSNSQQNSLKSSERQEVSQRSVGTTATQRSVGTTATQRSVETTDTQRSFGTTATPIEVQVEETHATEGLLHSSPTEVPHQLCHGYFSGGNSSDDVAAARATTYSQQPSCFRYLILPWQPLVATDRHVLLAVEESLSNDMDLSLILHTCQFFTDVMLQDFSAEVFLQRPSILKVFLDLLDSDKRVCEAVARCLFKLTTALRVRIHYYSDPGIANLKQEACKRPDSNLSSPSYISGHSSTVLDTGPCLNNTDSVHHNEDLAGFQGYQQQVPSEAGFSSDATEDSVLLQLQQLSLPQYCLLCIFHTLPHLGPTSGTQRQNKSHCALLAAELVKLFAMCVKESIWTSPDPVAQEVTEHLKQVLTLVGEVLEKHRSVCVDEEDNRLPYLQMLALTRKLLLAVVPVSFGNHILHRKLKNSLSWSLIDLSLITLFPTLHTDILQYVKTFKNSSDRDFLVKYKDTMAVCASMKAAINFLKNHDKLEKETFTVIDESLPSLPFHGNLDAVRHCVDIAVNRLHLMYLNESSWKVVTGVMLKLLSHAEPRVRLEMYGCCHKYVVEILGVQQVPRLSVDSSRRLDFLCNTAILIEIVSHGASSSDKKIRQYAEEMLIHLLKGKFLLPELAWRHFLECLIPALPLLQCYADKTTLLGRAIVKILEPETSHAIHLPRAEVLKGNLRLLFCSDPLTREEAVSRLTWLMGREERAYEKLPNFSSLRGLLLNSVCLMDKPVDLGQNRIQESLYQVSSLCQVVELLRSKGIEPVVRRSALTQVSVMLEDSNLHKQFLEQDGMNLILDILHKALVDKEFNNYPDSVIPCISALKSLVQHNPKIRQELSHHPTLFSCIVRAVYLYNGDDRLRPDSSVLVFLLLYSDFIMSVPEPDSGNSPWHRFSLPDLVARHMRLPFLCHTHWHSSPHTQHITKREVLEHKGCHSLLRLCWNAEWFGGLEMVLKWPAVPPNTIVNEEQLSDFTPELRLTNEDLSCLKATAMAHRCKQHLYDIQNATTHETVLQSLNCLTGYFALHILVNETLNCQPKVTSNLFGASRLESSAWWHDLPWSDTFKRFLGIPPACPEDQELLVSILQLLRLYLNICHRSKQDITEQKCWLTKILKDVTHPLPNLLMRVADAHGGSDSDSAMSKELCREILQLVQECSVRERKLEDSETAVVKKSGDHVHNAPESWIHIIHAITQNITFSDTQHFYNLAFLDWMLFCLVQLTSLIGWSNSEHVNVHKLWSELISCLAELVTAFHCGKGGASLASFMGLSITRNAVMCMNHLLCEMQDSTSNKGWEGIWLCSLGAETHATGHANLTWLPPLWLSRDPVVRSAALQLVAGFCSTRRGCGQLVASLSTIAGGVWGAGLSFLLEHEEASLVREQAAVLLTNVCSHSVSTSGGGATLNLCHTPVTPIEVPLTGVQAVLSLLSQCNFYGEVAILLSRLCIGSTVDPSEVNRTNGWNVEPLSGRSVPSGAGLQTGQYAMVYNRNIESSSSDEHQDSSEVTESLTDGSLQLEPHVKTTPSLVKAVCWLMVNLLALNPTDALHQINKYSLIRLLFSCLVAGIPIDDIKEGKPRNNVLLYMDILEMYSGICCILSKCVVLDKDCCSTILHTHDCVHSLLALLDPDIYSTRCPQLVFLRNQLWSQLFRLFSSILSCKQGYEAVLDALFHCGPWTYFLTFMMSVKNELCKNLCNSALNSITSLLSHEIKFKSILDASRSVGSLLDCNFPVTEKEENISNFHTIKHKSLKHLLLPCEEQTSDVKHEPVLENKSPTSHTDYNSKTDSSRNMICSKNQLSSQSQESANRAKGDSNKNLIQPKSKFAHYSSSSNESKAMVVSNVNESLSNRAEYDPPKTEEGSKIVGAELCNLLLCLYEVHSLQQVCGDKNKGTKTKNLVTGALSSLLAVSGEAKKVALSQGLLETLIIQLRELHVKLSLESAESLRRVSDKKRVCPVLRDVGVLLAILTNFLNGDKDVKRAAAEIGLADLVHKLWMWCCASSSLLEDVLKMLSTFTSSCLAASQSLVLTTTLPGVGLRKTPSSMSLLHAIVAIVHRDMEQVNRVHEAVVLNLAFQVLTNACQSQECRNIIAKSNLFQCLSKLHPSLTKKQKHWEAVELVWLEFLSNFTFYPEGQQAVPKIPDAMDLLTLLTTSTKTANKMAALCVLRNISFLQLNRPRLLAAGEFLQVLHQKLGEGTLEERSIAASMVWALVANNQKGKLIIKCAGIDAKLQEALTQLRLLHTSEDFKNDERIQTMNYVLRIIHAENSMPRKS